MKTKTVLSIDWDFFFPIPEHDPYVLYDWGHSENQSLFYGVVWVVRAADFISRGYELPITSGEEKTFWSRFTFRKDAPLYYAESHAYMSHRLVSDGATNVLNFDAHHDAGYDKKPFRRTEPLACDNWATHLMARNIKVKTVYPSWKFYAFDEEPHPQTEIERIIDDGKPVIGKIDAVFVCRSGAWVPGWLDDDFDDFIKRCPLRRQIQVGPLVQRTWKADEANDMSSKIEQMMKLGKEQENDRTGKAATE